MEANNQIFAPFAQASIMVRCHNSESGKGYIGIGVKPKTPISKNVFVQNSFLEQ